MSFYPIILTRFDENDYFRSNLTTKGLFQNFKKHKNKTKMLVKLGDYLGIFPNNNNNDNYNNN